MEKWLQGSEIDSCAPTKSKCKKALLTGTLAYAAQIKKKKKMVEDCLENVVASEKEKTALGKEPDIDTSKGRPHTRPTVDSSVNAYSGSSLALSRAT